MQKVNILKFSTEWCPPCKAMKPEIEKLKKEHKNWRIGEIDADADAEKADKYEIRAVPTLIISVGEKTERVSGFRSADEIEKIIEKLK